MHATDVVEPRVSQRAKSQADPSGWVEVICGPMFSGKTEELIRRVRRAQIAHQSVRVFKPLLDDRYAVDALVSHIDTRMAALPVASAPEIAPRVPQCCQVVGIDEGQFFADDLVDIAEQLADRGVRVIVAGLDTDYLGQPFEPIPQLMARAEYVTKLLAICVRCGRPANRSARISSGQARVEVGAYERYEAVCRRCHAPPARTKGSTEPDASSVESMEAKR